MPIGNQLGDMISEMTDPALSPQRKGEIVRILNELGGREETYSSWLQVQDGKISLKSIDLPFFLIYSEILSVAKASITIPIPLNAKHLFCIGAARCTGASYNEYINGVFNGDTGTNYDWNAISGLNATPLASQTKGATAFPFGYVEAASASAGSQGSFFSFIPHIQSALWKTALIIGGAPQFSATELVAALAAAHWKSTDPVRTITISAASSTMDVNSSFSVFGFN